MEKSNIQCKCIIKLNTQSKEDEQDWNRGMVRWLGALAAMIPWSRHENFLG